MTTKFKNIQLGFYLLFLLSILSCSSSEEKEEKNENEVSEYDDIKFTAAQFLNNLYYLNVKDAFLFCDNISKGNVKKLSNQFGSFNSTKLDKVDTCIIQNKNAYCNCTFVNGENLRFVKKLHLKKYEKEWLAHFILDENFDNIFVYDYSYEKLDQISKNPLSLTETQLEHIKNVFNLINSSDLVINFTGVEYLKSVDENVKVLISKSLSSEINDANLKIVNNYFQEDNIIINASVDIYIENHLDYYQEFLNIAVEEMGMPFNIPENTSQKDLNSFKRLRWFVKSYNEMITINFFKNYINISLQQIP